MKLRRRTFLQWALGVAGAHALPWVAHAQGYPARPVRFVIPFPPGGAFDAVGRPLADKLKSLLGTVVVENLGGGGACICASAVAHAWPDGFTLLVGGTLPHANDALSHSMPLYAPAQDLGQISAL